MIQRVYERAMKCDRLADVIIATDDQRIVEGVISFGGSVMMTSPEHTNGTERCAEVARKYGADYYINIQGDEPFIFPEQIDTLCGLLNGEVQLATLVKSITDPELLTNPNTMKVVFTKNMDALYFSRSCIPYIREASQPDWINRHQYYRHIGIYAYRSDVLQEVVQLPISDLERAESLEQLRWLENGYRIKVGLTDYESIGVDVPEDIKRALDFHRSEL